MTVVCRWCRAESGDIVLDLGEQPASDHFPRCADPGPDPLYPLQMWLCRSCGLAQLVDDPTVPEEPRAREPAALVAQAADAVERVAARGWLAPGGRVAEYGSPHGGSWLGLLARRGLTAVDSDEPADVVVDCFGLMHAADQAAAIDERVARVAPGGVLLLQYHALRTIICQGQWNALRHGHYAYYSTTAMSTMLEARGFVPRAAFSFDLYGGTVLLAATRTTDGSSTSDDSVKVLLSEDARTGITDPVAVGSVQRAAQSHAEDVHDWLLGQRRAGRRVLGYGAASRAVALLVRGGVSRSLLPAIADAAPGKQGRRMPGTDIPIVDPSQLAARHPDVVMLFLPDLLTEVRASYPYVEASGGQWVSADAVSSSSVA